MRRLGTPLFLLLLMLAAPARAQQPGYEAAGAAPVLGDAVRARVRALEEAMRRAIELAVTQAAPEARGRLYLVSARARDYIINYRVLEEKEAAAEFQLRILAQVDLPRLLRDLQVALPAAPGPSSRPTLLLCTDDPASGERLLASLRDGLLPRAEVLPPASCPAQLLPGDIMEAMTRTGARAALVLRTTEPVQPAEVRGTQPRLYGALCRVQLNLYGSRGSAEETQEAGGFADRPEGAVLAAQRSAATAALTPLLPRLGALFPTENNDGVVVTLEGIERYADYGRMLKLLSAMPGVATAEPRRFVGARGDARGNDRAEAQIEVLLRTQGMAEPLGAALGRTPIPGLRLQVVPEGPRRLRVLVVAESALPAAPAPAPAPAPAADGERPPP